MSWHFVLHIDKLHFGLQPLVIGVYVNVAGVSLLLSMSNLRLFASAHGVVTWK